MTALEGVPDDVRIFIDQCIDSIEQLEVLLMLWRARGEALTTESITRELGSSAGSILRRLQTLVTIGLADPVGDRFRYRADPTQDAVLERVAKAYRERRVSMITYVVNRPSQTLRAFSDAFRIRDPRSK